MNPLTQPTTEQLVHGHRIGEIATAWSELPQTLYTSEGWLRTCEGAAADQDYLLLSDGERVVGGLVAYATGPRTWIFNNPVELLVRDAVDLDEFTTAAERAELDDLRARLDPTDGYPALVSVLPGGYHCGLLRREDATPATVAALLDGFEGLADARAVGTRAVMHVPEDDAELSAELARRGYHAFASSGDCVLIVSWSSFDGYLAMLTRHRRNTVRKERAAFAAAGTRLVDVPMDAMGAEHAHLHSLLMQRYGHTLDDEAALGRIRSIQEHNAGMGWVVEARRGEELVGFVLVYRSGGDLYPKMFGVLDGEQRYFTYFNLAYYGLIERAIGEGHPAVVYGPEAYDAKAARGCTLLPRVNFVKGPARWKEGMAPLARLTDRRYRARMNSVSWLDRPDRNENR